MPDTKQCSQMVSAYLTYCVSILGKIDNNHVCQLFRICTVHIFINGFTKLERKTTILVGAKDHMTKWLRPN